MKKAELDKAYYDGNPLITDAEYDALFPDSNTLETSGGDFPHAWRMYSLQKYYSDQGEPPYKSVSTITTPKLDGAAISILYIEGKLVRALTRGNGILGKDITSKVALLVPSTIPTHFFGTGKVQVTGEVVVPKNIPNARNLAAGSLNLKDIEEFKTRLDKLKFVAYDAIHNEYETNYNLTLDELRKCGFTTVLDSGLDIYPQDGKVIRENNYIRYQSLGYTELFPRAAYAYKERQKPVVTKLLDVVWQTGKSGKVTPVALLEPVMINGASIARATLNNLDYIRSLNLELGCLVEVVRSGEIIPCIVGRAEEKIDLTSAADSGIIYKLEIHSPDTCPSCDSTLNLVNSQLFCENTSCGAKTLKQLEHFAKTMKIKGLGPKTLEKLDITEIWELYELDEKYLSEVLGPTIGAKLSQEIQRAKTTSLDIFLAAFSIPLIGNTAARKLSTIVANPSDITNSVCQKAGLGEKATNNILEWVHTYWEDFGDLFPVQFSVAEAAAESLDIVVVITGKLNDYKNRRDAEAELTSLGIQCKSSITKQTNYVVSEEGRESSTLKKAKALNIPVVTIKQLKDIIGETI